MQALALHGRPWPLLLSRPLLAILSNTFSASTLSPPPPPRPPPPLPPLSPLLPQTQDDTISTVVPDIIASFRAWFLTAGAEQASMVDAIYGALAAGDEGALAALPLSEKLVLAVLHGGPLRRLGEEALLLLRLRFFDWSGRRPNYRHSRAVYHTVFRLLARAHRSSVVLEWLRLFSVPASLGTPSHPRFHDTLVVGYAVAGQPQLALRQLGCMRFRGLDLDVFSSHVLLNSLVDASFHEFADSLFSQLALRHAGPHPVATCIRIKSLCLRGRLADAEALLHTLPFSEASRGPAAGTVVTALCHRGRLDDATRLVNTFSSCDVYGAWIHGLVSAGLLDDTLRFLSEKKNDEGYIASAARYEELVHHLLCKNRLGDVYDMLVEMMEEGIAPGRSTMNAVLCFFCKAGLVDVAMHLYRSRMELGINPNKDVYNNLIGALCRSGETDAACRVLEEGMACGFFPGRQTFTMFTNVLCREGKLDKARELLNRALKMEAQPMDTALAKYLVALCKTGNVEEACLVPQMASGKDGLYRYESTYKSLIRAFILMRRPDVLPQLIIEMQEMGHMPSRNLYRSVVCTLCEMDRYSDILELLEKQLERNKIHPRTCYNYFILGAGYAKKADMAMEVYRRMVSAGIEPGIQSNSLLLLSYLRSKRIGDALNLFNLLREKKEPSAKLYNVLICGLCEAGKPEQAMVFWREAREKGFIPSITCYEELVHLLSSIKDYDSVVKVIDDFRGTGRPVSAFLCNVLLLHTLRSSNLLKAWFRSRDNTKSIEVRKEDIQDRSSGRLLLGQLIALFAGGIRNMNNLDNLEVEMEKYFPLDIFTYNMLLRGLTRAGRMDSACSMFERLCNKGYKPNRWTFDIMVHGFCKHGDRNKAERWMEAMYRNGFFPTWHTMRLYNNISLEIHDQSNISLV